MFERMLGVVLQVLSADELEVLCQSARTMLVALDRVAERAAGAPSSDY
jgi:hypothetical protein